jgi:hypothetical protein
VKCLANSLKPVETHRHPLQAAGSSSDLIVSCETLILIEILFCILRVNFEPLTVCGNYMYHFHVSGNYIYHLL